MSYVFGLQLVQAYNQYDVGFRSAL